MFFKKKIDWSKYTKAEEPVKKIPPKPVVSYPHEVSISRESKRLTNQTFSLRATIMNVADDMQLSIPAMQVALLMDLRDKFDALISRFDTLVEALNKELEDDKINS